MAVAVVPYAAVVVAGRLLRAAALLRRLGVAAVPRRLHDGPEGRRLQLSQYIRFKMMLRVFSKLKLFF